jgi:RNA polymerase sigma factor (sigma-70 family)
MINEATLERPAVIDLSHSISDHNLASEPIILDDKDSLEESKTDTSRFSSVNWESLVSKTINGDIIAQDKLFFELNEKFSAFFRRRNPAMAEDLVNNTLIDIHLALDSFDPTKGLGSTFNENFNAWAMAIGRRNQVDVRRRESKHQAISIEDNDIVQPNPEPINEEPSLLRKYKPIFQEQLSNYLGPIQNHIIEQRLAGLTPVQIASATGLTERTIKSNISKARKIIEEEIMLPAGLRKITDYEHLSRKDNKRIQSVNFLGRSYTNNEWVKDYLIKNRPDEDASTILKVEGDKRTDLEVLIPDLDAKYQELLPNSLLEVAKRLQLGEDWDQVAKEMNLTKEAIIQRVKRIRKIIEPAIIYPLGLKKVADYHEIAVSHAAYQGELKTVKICAMRYTQPEWVEEYKRNYPVKS